MGGVLSVCVCVALLDVYDVIFMRSPISVNSSIYPLGVQQQKLLYVQSKLKVLVVVF